MDLLGAIKSFFGAIGAVFGWIGQRDREKNAPDVKAAKIAQQEQAEKDKTNRAMQRGDEDELRKEVAE